jgi:hypothetical protein
MARLTIEKMYQNETWVNVYWLAGAIGDNGAAAADIIQAEQAVHYSPILITKARLDDGVEDTDVYANILINEFGARAIGSSQLLPLFNCLRVDFAAGGGSPSRKYLRGCLSEADVNFMTIDPDGVVGLQGLYGTPVAAVANFVDVDGEDITQATTFPFVQMRQLRRGSKKKTTPSSPTPV